MATTIDFAHQVDEAGMDAILNNARVRATPSAITVRSVTFPANRSGINYIDGIGTPISTTGGGPFTLDTGQILTGIVTIKPTASGNLSFDTAAQMVAGVNQVTTGAQVGDVITCLIVNGAALASGFNITPVTSTGVTYDANNAGVIQPATSRYVWFRFTNVTPGSEAVVVYF